VIDWLQMVAHDTASALHGAQRLPDSIHVILSQPPAHPEPLLTYIIPGAAALAALALPIWQLHIAKKQIGAQLRVAEKQLEAQSAIAQSQINATVRSANRMKWVEHLRLQVAEYLAQAAAFKRRIKDGPIPPDEFHSRIEILARTTYTIILSLTPGDPEHDQLSDLLHESMQTLSAPPAQQPAPSAAKRIEQLTQKLLKDAWEAAKRLE
jgi:hypothetical protein